MKWLGRPLGRSAELNATAPQSVIALDFAPVLAEWPLLARGVAGRSALTAVAAGVGVVGRRRLRLGAAARPAWLKAIVGGYVELIRNTPFIVQLFFIFFGLPGIGVKLSPETASVIAMVINLGAYAAEIVRAGIETTPQGQIEAAQSLALTELQVFTARGAAACAAASLAGAGEPDHHRDARLGGVRPDLDATSSRTRPT